MRSFDLREVNRIAIEKNADPITVLFAMKNGTLDQVRKHEIPESR
jgi:hypothetical protein